MSTNTILLLLGAVLIALLVSYFQYFFKAKTKGKITYVLAFLRFLGLFLILVLLINPSIEIKSYQIQKSSLAVAVDNSKSISLLTENNEVSGLVERIKNNKALNAKFDLNYFELSNELKPLSNLNFEGEQTKLDKVAVGLNTLYRSSKMPVLLVTDGNATSGANYVYSFKNNFNIYPIVVGDTTSIFDLSILKVNVNKFTFLNNKFPLEVFINSNSKKANTAIVSVLEGKKVVSQKKIEFNSLKTGTNLSFLLDAKRLGLNNYTVTVKGNLTEKNTSNNTKSVAVQVIDQRAKMAIVTDMNHPDIAVLKRSIETNEQREVAVVKPNDSSLAEFDFFILYQPNSSFSDVYMVSQNKNIPVLTITGTKTDFKFLSKQQQTFDFSAPTATENYSAVLNPNFSSFINDDVSFTNFPPLNHPFVNIKTLNNADVFLYSKINNISTNQPLLAFTEEKGLKKSYLFGENIWKWRLDYYKNHNDFDNFDVLISKIIQYASNTDKKKNLILDYKNNYLTSEDVEFRAQFFNKSFELDLQAKLKIQLTNTETKEVLNATFIPNTNFYSLNLNDLAAGNYSFVATEEKSKTSVSGSFQIQYFDAEWQFATPNYAQLNQLALQNKGAVHLLNETNKVIDLLVNNEQYKPVQKEVYTKTPLIDWLNLLILALILFATEWFIRKYNGLL